MALRTKAGPLQPVNQLDYIVMPLKLCVPFLFVLADL